MRIVLDAMGSDTHPQPELEAALTACRAVGDPVILRRPRGPAPARLLERMGADSGPGRGSWTRPKCSK